MMLFYYIFIVSLTICLAKEKTEEKTESKDKRQINQSVIYGQHIAGQYVNRPRQQEPEYYNALHPEQPEQQQQQQQVEARASIKQTQIARPQQIQYQFLPQQQEQQYVAQQNIQSQIAQTQLSPSQLKLQEFQQQSSNAKPISEAEFQDLVKKSEADLRAATANQQKYAFPTVGQQKSLAVPQPLQSPGLGAYKNSLLEQSQSQQQQQQQQPPQPQIHIQQQLQPQQQVQPQQFIPQIQNSQSYKQSAAIQNPLGDFSLEKELEKLEASNKAIDELVAKYGNAKPNKFNFKSSQPAINNVPFKQQAQQPLFQQQQQQQQQKQQTQQYSFITPEISQFAQYQGKQPEKLIGQPQQQLQQQQPQYIQEVSGNAANAKINTEYNFQFLNSNNENNKRPQQISAAPLKYQYFSQDDENEQQQQQQQQQPQQQLTKLNQKSSNFKIVQSPQLQYEKLQQQQQPQSIPNNFQYYKTPATSITKPQEIPLPQQQQPIAPSSHSSIYVSQTTGLRNKLIAQQQQQQQQQQLLQHQPQQEQTILPTKERIQSPVTLPPPNSKTPISQEEFQALVDAGFKVQAIPVPVPMESGKYQQVVQQQQRQFYQPIQESFQQNTNKIPRYQQPQNQQSILDYPNVYV